MARKRKTITVNFMSHSYPDIIMTRLRRDEYAQMIRCVKENLFLDGGIREWIGKHASRYHRRKLRPLYRLMDNIQYIQPDVLF